MPNVRRYRKPRTALALGRLRRKKKMYRTKRRSYKRGKAYPLFRNLLPNWPMKTKMAFTYNQGIILSTPGTAGVYTEKIYRLNGCWDPEAAIGGNNVYGFDQFMGTMYDRYYCYKTEVTVTACSTPESTSVYCGMFVRQTGASTTTSVDTLINQPGQMWRLVSGGNHPVSMKRTIYHRKYFPFENMENLCGNSGADPTAEVYGAIWVADSSYASGPGVYPVAISVRLKYFCVLGRKDIVPVSA